MKSSSKARQEDSLLDWSAFWVAALKKRFPSRWQKLIPKVGTGWQQLLWPESEADLNEARHAFENGLLVSQAPSRKILQVSGQLR